MTGKSRFAARQFLVIVAGPLGRVRGSVENALSAVRERKERGCDEDRDGKRGTNVGVPLLAVRTKRPIYRN